jgi:hypothetical protein
MDFRHLSFPQAPLVKIVPPGPKSKQYLDYQILSESTAVSYPKGLPMAIRREYLHRFFRGCWGDECGPFQSPCDRGSFRADR